MGFQSAERFRCGAVLTAPPLPGAPQVAIHIILVHPSCSTIEALRSALILPSSFAEGKPKLSGILSGILSGMLFDLIDHCAIFINDLRCSL
jgi:hypothetical protein